MKTTLYFFSITIFFISTLSFAQIKEYHLTHKLSNEEQVLMQNTSRSFTETAPPTGSVRNIAEWEEMESVLIAYDGGFGIPFSLIADMSQETNVVTIVSNSSEKDYVLSLYESNGVNTEHCAFVFQDPDSYWTRDYSPWFIAVDDSEVAIVNFPYNRPRPHDNDVPLLMAEEMGVDLYGMNVTHTGGNYMCDGYGIAASTDLVTDEEELSLAEINTKMHDYLGIDTYHVTLDPLDDYIKHIDCWGKFLDVDKVLITQVPESDYRYDDYEAVATYFAEQNCSWGYAYEIFRVQAADYSDYDVNPYSNSLILNNKVYVPQTGSSLDDEAISVYQEAMPGYEVIGVLSDSWINSDALHCRTHGVADTDMLFIKHYPLHGEVAYQPHYTIEADVVSYGGSAISSGFPKLYYKVNDGDWQNLVMNNTSGITYSVDLPAEFGDNTVSYYIYAENENSKTASQPRMGMSDPHIFFYNSDTTTVSELQADRFSIVPNPATSSFTLDTDMTHGSITIYNLKGQLVYSDYFSSNKNVTNVELDPGLYIVNLESSNAKQIEKLIIE